MSGLEVAGLVLGALPLAIKALQSYRSVASAWRLINRDIENIVQDLETELLTLRNTCELLLDGIAPSSTIIPMIENPLGPEWKALSSKLRGRLWTSNEKFEREVRGMMEAVEELKAMLKIDSEGKAQSLDRNSLMQELKRHTGPLLRKSDYKEILSRIHGSNETLQTLTKQSCQLEPSRQRRSQWRLIQVVRKVSQGMFNALQRSLTCQCSHFHDLSLELRLRELVVLDSERDEDVAKSLDFHVALGSTVSPNSPKNPGIKEPGCQKWNHVKVQIIQDDSTPPTTAPPSTHLPAPPKCASPCSLPKNTQSRKKKKSVRFSGVFSWVGIKESSPLTTISPSPTIQTTTSTKSTNHCNEKQKVLLSDLCSAIHTSESSLSLDCCGYVADTLWDHETKFGIYPATHPALPASVNCTALRAALVGEQANLPPLEFAQRLEISLALVISALQLYQTSWVTDIITIDDIMFFHEAQTSLYRPFIIKSLRKPDKNQSSQCLARVNTVLLSLGVLLINLALNDTKSTLEMIRSPDINNVLSIYEHASNLICRLPVYGSNNCTAAAKWCLDNVIGRLDSFGHDSFCQDFYSNVVVPLNEDAQLLLSSTG